MPPQPRGLFETMWQELSGAGWVGLIQASIGERVIAAEICVGFKDVFSIIYAGIDYRLLDYSAMKRLDWFAIELACASGYASLDFLQSHVRNAGLRFFKRGFGTTEIPIKYHYNPLVGSTNTLRELLVGSRSPLPNLIRALVRRIPSPGLELLGRAVFKHVG
jgi:lipid II:glycine glycyltransferase (peptidoglycan interpeptide bridge formation enzyme)